ncbi:MAG: DUF2516 family protein [Micrococcales bacterium]|nr:DUF2516 family protein [Micrococcales bacterium]
MLRLTNSFVIFLFSALSLAALVIEVWAFGDCLTRRASAFYAEGKLKKTTWLLLTGIAALVGVSGVPLIRGGIGFGGLLSIAAVVVAIVYLVDVRPAVRGARPQRRPRRGSW